MAKQNGPQPTPISVITTLFTRPNQPPLIINGIEKIDIKTQIEILNPDKCGTMDGRKLCVVFILFALPHITHLDEK